MKIAQMQMAMVLTAQKPTQRERFGEFSEGLPGSTLERGMGREKRQEPFGRLRTGLGDPNDSCTIVHWFRPPQ